MFHQYNYSYTSMANKQPNNKCDHNQDVKFLCLSPDCLAPSSICLDQCLSLHTHHQNQRISIEDLQQLLKLFSNENAKPKCRSIQQSIFAQFTILKAEFSEILDNLCRILINKIGYPYLNVHGQLSTYKRLKNKQYRKIDQTQLIDFVNFSKKKMSEMNIMLSQGKVKQMIKKKVSKLYNGEQNINLLVREQRELYQKEVDFNMKVIQSIQILIKDFQNKAFSFVQENQRNNVKVKCEKDFTEGFSKLKDIVKVAKNRYKTQKEQQLANKIKQEQNQADFIKEFQQEVKKQNKNDPSVSENTTTQEKETRSRLKDNRKKERIRQSTSNDIGLIKTPHLKRQVSIERQLVPSNKNRFSHINKQKKQLSDEQDSKDINVHITDVNKNKKTLLNNSSNSPRKNSVDAKVTSKLACKAEQLKSNSKNNSESRKNTEQQKFSSQNTMGNLFSNKASIVSQRKKSVELKQQLFLVQLPTCRELVLQKSSKKIKKQYSHNLNNRESNQFDLIKKIALIRHKNEQNANIEEGDLEMQVSLLLLVQAIKAPKNAPEDIKKIITYLQTAIQYCQKNLSASQLLAFIYFQQNEPQQSLEVCEYFMDKNTGKLKKQDKITRPDVCMIHLITTKAGALNALGRFSETIKFIQQGRYVQQQFINSLKSMEAAHNEIFEQISANELIFFKKKQTGIPSLSKLLKNLADAYLQLGDYDTAIKYYQLSLAQCDSFDESYYNLAVCYYFRKDYSLAWKQLGKAVNFALTEQTKQQYMQFKKRMEQQANQ